MELQVSIDLNPCGQAGLFSFLFGVYNARGIFFDFFDFFLDRKILPHIINRSQIQTATIKVRYKQQHQRQQQHLKKTGKLLGALGVP